MKTYAFLLNFGYAEDGGLSFTPFVSSKKFSSTKAAFTDLANFFKDAFMGEPKVHSKPCCIASVAAKHNHCSKCGRNLLEKEFDAEGYIEFVRGIDGASCDSYHSGIVDYDEQARWQSELPADLDKVKIIYTAEKCLVTALGYPPFNNNKITVDSIFKNHRKTDSFSFWG